MPPNPFAYPLLDTAAFHSSDSPEPHPLGCHSPLPVPLHMVAIIHQCSLAIPACSLFSGSYVILTFLTRLHTTDVTPILDFPPFTPAILPIPKPTLPWPHSSRSSILHLFPCHTLTQNLSFPVARLDSKKIRESQDDITTASPLCI